MAFPSLLSSTPRSPLICKSTAPYPAGDAGYIKLRSDRGFPPYRISGQMTGALVIYSATFMRYSLAVTPKNYLLFLCHFVNEGSQLTQGYRYLNWHYWGGKDAATAAKDNVKETVEAVKDKAKEVAGK